MGWDKIDEVGIEIKKVETEFANHAIKVFGRSHDGKAFMEFLRKKFLTAVVMTPENTASYGYWREGQNSIIRKIINSVEKDFIKQRNVPIAKKGEKNAR